MYKRRKIRRFGIVFSSERPFPAAQVFASAAQGFSSATKDFFLLCKVFPLPRKVFPAAQVFSSRARSFLPRKIFPLPRSSFPFLFSILNFSVTADSFQNADFRSPLCRIFNSASPRHFLGFKSLLPPCGGNSFFFQTAAPPFVRFPSSHPPIRAKPQSQSFREEAFSKRKSAPRKHSKDALLL